MPTNTKALQVAEPAGIVAGKNAVINGGFDIWQRGTSIASGAAAPYTADRWQIGRSGSVAGITVSRQATNDTTNLPNIQYCARVQRDSGNTSTAQTYFMQSFETANAIPFAGKTITISLYARSGANFSQASSQLNVRIDTGTGTDQNVFTGYSGSATVMSQNPTLTTTWQRFSYSVTLASTVTELGILLNYIPVGTAGANDYFEVTGVQLELGSVATPFSRAGGTIQGELAACQRYFQRLITGNSEVVGAGMAYGTVNQMAPITFVTEMRVAPTFTVSAVTDFVVGNTGTDRTVATFTYSKISKQRALIDGTNTGGVTGGQAIVLMSQNANARMDASAEL